MRAAQLSYLADVFSHGVVIQPSFGLELLFAVLTLQGILQLRELEGNHHRGHSSPFIFPGAAAAPGPSSRTQQALQYPCPHPNPGLQLRAFFLLSWILLSNPYASIFGEYSNLDIDLKPYWLETSVPGVLVFLLKG